MTMTERAYEGPDRRVAHPLSDDQINAIAEAAAEKALEKVYGEIGKSVAKGILWVLGAGALAFVAWLGKIGAWK